MPIKLFLEEARESEKAKQQKIRSKAESRWCWEARRSNNLSRSPSLLLSATWTTHSFSEFWVFKVFSRFGSMQAVCLSMYLLVLSSPLFPVWFFFVHVPQSPHGPSVALSCLKSSKTIYAPFLASCKQIIGCKYIYCARDKTNYCCKYWANGKAVSDVIKRGLEKSGNDSSNSCLEFGLQHIISSNL